MQTPAWAATDVAKEPNIFDRILQPVIDLLSILEFKVDEMPLIVLWLIIGSIFFTIRMNFINFRGFKHAIDVTRGIYDDPHEPGEVSHFQALATALAGTVGLGNIAGVAIAISIGGPGAAFWMTIAGLFAMTMKFVECTLGQKYRIVRADGSVAGGPMYYLSKGLAEKGHAKLGKILAIVFCVLSIIGGGAGSSMFQTNQSYLAVSQVFPWVSDKAWLYGLVMCFLVGIVILGGMKRIGTVAGAIVPIMCGIYMLAALWVLAVNFILIPQLIGTIVSSAFVPQAVTGGLIGVIAQGFRRAAYSNTAGQGVAAIAHAAAKTDEPVEIARSADARVTSSPERRVVSEPSAAVRAELSVEILEFMLDSIPAISAKSANLTREKPVQPEMDRSPSASATTMYASLPPLT